MCAAELLFWHGLVRNTNIYLKKSQNTLFAAAKMQRVLLSLSNISKGKLCFFFEWVQPRQGLAWKGGGGDGEVQWFSGGEL